MNTEIYNQHHKIAQNHINHLVAYLGGAAAEAADVGAWLRELSDIAATDVDIKSHLITLHMQGPRLYAPLDGDIVDPQVQSAGIKLLGTVFSGSLRAAAFTARVDGNRLLNVIMAALLEPASPEVRASAQVTIAQLLSVGDEATKFRYQGLFLEAAAAYHLDLELGSDMLAELSAAQLPGNQCRRWTLTETGVRAIQIMLGSTRKIVQVPALELVRDVIRVPGGLNLAAGDALLVANQSLIQRSRVPAAITRIVRADIELKPSPTFYVATTAVETIAVLLTTPGEGDSQLTAAEAFHAAGLGSLLSELLHYSFLACEPQVLVSAVIYSLDKLIRLSAEALSVLTLQRPALLRIAGAMNELEEGLAISEGDVTADETTELDEDVIEGIHEAITLVKALLRKNDITLDMALVTAGVLDNARAITHSLQLPLTLRLPALDICTILEPAYLLVLVDALREHEGAEEDGIRVQEGHSDGSGGNGGGGITMQPMVTCREGHILGIKRILAAGFAFTILITIGRHARRRRR